MNSKIKKIVCVVLAVLIIAAVAIIAFVIPSAIGERGFFEYYKENYPFSNRWYDYYKKEYAISVTVIAFASFSILSNGFLLFVFLKNSNALEYVKMNANELAALRKKKALEKQEKKKQKLQSKLNEINQKTV